MEPMQTEQSVILKRGRKENQGIYRTPMELKMKLYFRKNGKNGKSVPPTSII
jgi:hypothetical protein